MRVVLQRVKEAEVRCSSGHQASIARGLLLLAGVERADTPEDARFLAARIPHLRLFPDAQGVMNLSLLDMNRVEAGAFATAEAGVPGQILLVSQFTLHADTRRGRRPYYGNAAPPESAIPLLDSLANLLRGEGVPVGTGVFGDHMDIRLCADGPVTLLLDSRASAS